MFSCPSLSSLFLSWYSCGAVFFPCVICFLVEFHFSLPPCLNSFPCVVCNPVFLPSFPAVQDLFTGVCNCILASCPLFINVYSLFSLIPRVQVRFSRGSCNLPKGVSSVFTDSNDAQLVYSHFLGRCASFPDWYSVLIFQHQILTFDLKCSRLFLP